MTIVTSTFQKSYFRLFTACHPKPFPPPTPAPLQRVLPSLMHGEAVNIDMAFMTYVAHARGLITAEEKEQIIQCMRGLELPVWHSGCSWPLIKRALMERLKHSGGQPRMPLPTGLGVAGTAAAEGSEPPGAGAWGGQRASCPPTRWETRSVVRQLYVSGFNWAFLNVSIRPIESQCPALVRKHQNSVKD